MSPKTTYLGALLSISLIAPAAGCVLDEHDEIEMPQEESRSLGSVRDGARSSSHGSGIGSDSVSADVGSWSQTGSLAADRILHTATRLADGRVMVVGGFNPSAEL